MEPDHNQRGKSHRDRQHVKRAVYRMFVGRVVMLIKAHRSAGMHESLTTTAIMARAVRDCQRLSAGAFGNASCHMISTSFRCASAKCSCCGVKGGASSSAPWTRLRTSDRVAKLHL